MTDIFNEFFKNVKLLKPQDYQTPIKSLSFTDLEAIIAKALSEALGTEMVCEVHQVRMGTDQTDRGESDLKAHAEITYYVKGAQISRSSRHLLEAMYENKSQSEQLDADPVIEMEEQME